MLEKKHKWENDQCFLGKGKAIRSTQSEKAVVPAVLLNIRDINIIRDINT